MRVLVAEKIGASGVALLREHFDVDEGDHLERIEEYDGILIRSATKLTADVLDRAGVTGDVTRGVAGPGAEVTGEEVTGDVVTGPVSGGTFCKGSVVTVAAGSDGTSGR